MPVPGYALSHLTPEADYTSNPKQAAVYAYLAGGHQESQQWLEIRYTGASAAGCRMIQSLNETVLTVLVP